MDRLPTPVFLSFPGGSDSKESAHSVGDLGSIPGLGRPPGGGHGNTLQYSSLENSHGQRSLVGYSPWGRKESDTTERLSTHTTHIIKLHVIVKNNKGMIYTGNRIVSVSGKITGYKRSRKWMETIADILVFHVCMELLF